MRKTTGPARIVVVEIDPGRATAVYRIVRSEHRDDPVLLNSLRSNYELERPPRKNSVERSSTVIHMGISAYLDAGIAGATAQKWPKLGDYIAEIHLSHGHGFNYANTGHPLHLTIWADPVKLRDAIVSIWSVN